MKPVPGSSSPPAPGYSSPPVSPTVTHVSSRSPTPSAPELAAVHGPSKELVLRSSSPARSRSPHSKPSRMTRAGRTSDHGCETPRSIPSEGPLTAAAAGPRPPRLLRLLPVDTSQYTSETIPTAAVTTSSTSLAELAYLVRLQKHHDHRQSHAKSRLHRRLVAFALNTRLVNCGRLAYRALLDHFRSDDKKNFATLYNAIHDVRASCEDTRRFALLDPELQKQIQDESIASTAVNEPKKPVFATTWMHALPLSTRQEILAFLSVIRTNPSFLAARLASLSHSDLLNLVSSRSSLDSAESVFSSQAVSNQKTTGKPGSIHNVTKSGPNQTERLLSFARHDPFSSLLFTIFGPTSTPDSAEDKLRTDAWALSCAKLIVEHKNGWNKFLELSLDAWAAMRNWGMKPNLEAWLMGVLEDGQFLLQEAPTGTRIRQGQFAAETNTKDAIRAEEFFDAAVLQLFELVGSDSSSGGLPEGAIELGQAIVRALHSSTLPGAEKRHRVAIRHYIVLQWFFLHYLTDAIVWPEAHGMMMSYHVSEHARQQIFRTLSQRVQKQANDLLTWHFHKSATGHSQRTGAPTLPEIREKIDGLESIFKLGKGSSSHAASAATTSSKTLLVSSKSIVAPAREAMKVQPFIVVSPSDIITLVDALFPNRRPPSSSSSTLNFRTPSLKQAPSQLSLNTPSIFSTASSLSSVAATAQSIPALVSTPGDGSSVLSQSASSATSDTTAISRVPLLADGQTRGAAHDHKHSSGLTASSSCEDLTSPDGVQPSEEYGIRLRRTCQEMLRVLNTSTRGTPTFAAGCQPQTGSLGSCHPAAEKWAVLYVGPDGRELELNLFGTGPGDGADDDGTSEEEEEETADGSMRNSLAHASIPHERPHRVDLESDYHDLKNAITRLVEEYEVPKEMVFQDHDAVLPTRQANVARGRSEASKNPYHPAGLREQSPSAAQSYPRPRHRSTGTTPSGVHRRTPEPSDSHKHTPSLLLSMLESAYHASTLSSDYISANTYHNTLLQLHSIASSSLTRNNYAALLHMISRGPREALARAGSTMRILDRWLDWLTMADERLEGRIEEMMTSMDDLRDKMWYVTDVKNSAGYENARNVAVALRIMGQVPLMPGDPVAATANPDAVTHEKSSFGHGLTAAALARARGLGRQTTGSEFLVKTEAQTLDLLAAGPDQGGPNKLSDEQSKITADWLSAGGVENFCRGEERLHRFCLEIERCVNKIIGDGIMDGPVLWSSELYRRDRALLDGKGKGDWWTGMAGMGLDDGSDSLVASPGGRASFSSMVRPGTAQTVSSLRGLSATNLSSQSVDSVKWGAMDPPDYFGLPSPWLSIDSNVTFWSPFSHAPTQDTPVSPSTSGIRPGTASSTKSATNLLKPVSPANEGKRMFLLTLKRTLTGLLLSDLGTLVFHSGSETDAWFSGDLGTECLIRKEEKDRKKRRMKRRKSMRTLKVKNEQLRQENRGNYPLETLGRGERGDPAPPVSTLHHAGSTADYVSAGEYSTSSSEANRSSAVVASSLLQLKRDDPNDFPYQTAFRRLLAKFARHPSPFVKLDALFELEQLIVAQLSAKTGQQFGIVRREPERGAGVAQAASAVDPGEWTLADRTVKVPGVTTAQNLEEAIQNCAERRSHSMTTAAHGLPPAPASPRCSDSPAAHRRTPEPRTATIPSMDMIVEVMQHLFSDAGIRPRTLFRDLQYVASFVPASQLDRSAKGKAFWDAGLAALSLKADVCRIMVEIADDIVAANTQNRTSAGATGAGTAPTAQESTTGAERHDVGTPAPDDPVSRFTMSDAARMLLITAKEGDAAAERELAILYLTHPDLVPRTVLPLTAPGTVFKPELLGARDRKREDPARSDPATMCVAQHWMEMSRKGGDSLATKYLRARDEIESIP